MSSVTVLIDGKETNILDSKLEYFQKVLGAELVEKQNSKPNKKQNKNKK